MLVAIHPGIPVLPGMAQQVVHQRLGVDPLLDIQGRRVDGEVAQVLLVLAPPHQLGIQIPVAALVGDLDGSVLLVPQQGLVFGAGQVAAGGVLVGQGLHSLGGGGTAGSGSGHGYFLLQGTLGGRDSHFFGNSLETQVPGPQGCVTMSKN